MKQNLQKHSRDLHVQDKCDLHVQDNQFQENDLVLAMNFYSVGWITGKIFKKPGATTFQVELSDGQAIRCHADQLKHNSLDPQISLQPDGCNEITDKQWLLPVADSTNINK